MLPQISFALMGSMLAQFYRICLVRCFVELIVAGWFLDVSAEVQPLTTGTFFSVIYGSLGGLVRFD